MEIQDTQNVTMMMEVVQEGTQKAIAFLPTLSMAILTMVLGLLVISCFTRFVQNKLERFHLPEMPNVAVYSKVSEDSSEDDDGDEKRSFQAANTKEVPALEPTLIRFGMSLTKYTLRLLLFITCCSMLGIHTTSWLHLVSGFLFRHVSKVGPVKKAFKGIAARKFRLI